MDQREVISSLGHDLSMRSYKIQRPSMQHDDTFCCLAIIDGVMFGDDVKLLAVSGALLRVNSSLRVPLALIFNRLV